MAALSGMTLIGGTVVCGGVLFFVFCVGLAVWYFFKQPKQEVSATAPEPVVQATIEHPTAAAPSTAPSPRTFVPTPPAEKTPSDDE